MPFRAPSSGDEDGAAHDGATLHALEERFVITSARAAHAAQQRDGAEGLMKQRSNLGSARASGGRSSAAKRWRTRLYSSILTFSGAC